MAVRWAAILIGHWAAHFWAKLRMMSGRRRSYLLADWMRFHDNGITFDLNSSASNNWSWQSLNERFRVIQSVHHASASGCCCLWILSFLLTTKCHNFTSDLGEKKIKISCKCCCLCTFSLSVWIMLHNCCRVEKRKDVALICKADLMAIWPYRLAHNWIVTSDVDHV